MRLNHAVLIAAAATTHQLTPKRKTRPPPQPADATTRLCLLVGLPGSGKSTCAELFAQRGWTVVNQDALGTRKRCERVAAAALDAGERVVVDRCNFDRTQRSHWTRILAGRGRAVCLWLDVPAETCVARVLGREAHRTLPPEPESAAVVHKLARTFVAPSAEDERFDVVVRATAADLEARGGYEGLLDDDVFL
mmetsp:Transcript_277/g.751  ORF Transcript_277/g.751 Transcript_277/m.751 type:complete len:193 (-) Transcript_277:23-601(-)